MNDDHIFAHLRTDDAAVSAAGRGRGTPSADDGACSMNSSQSRKARRRPMAFVDGRVQRSERTRFNIVSSYMLLIRRNLREPTMREVSAAAGCSLRSVYERMVNTHTLRLSVLDYAISTGPRNFDPRLAGLGRYSRLEAIVRFQAGEYDHWGPLWHLMMQYEPFADIKVRLDRIRREILQARMDKLYLHELTTGSEAERADWLRLLNALTSFENWRYLRYICQLDFEEICRHWTWCVDRIFSVANAQARPHPQA